MAENKKGRERKHHFDKQLENAVISQVIDVEYVTARGNRQEEVNDFESFIGIFDADRAEKNYDWNSDVSTMEFTSQMLTQSSQDADRYFQTRDFVETYLMDDSDEAVAAAKSNEELVNRTLNQIHLHHFQKYMRMTATKNIGSHVYLRCWWEQKTEKRKTGERPVQVDLDVDTAGEPIIDEDLQTRAQRTDMEDVIEDVVTADRFNYDIVDMRNVYTDNNYTYTLQEKDFVTIETDKTLVQIKAMAESRQYFNLELLKDLEPPTETTASKNTDNRYDNKPMPKTNINKHYDLLERFGGYWVTVQERDSETGLPTKVKPGIDPVNSEPLDKAEYHECIITFVKSSTTKIMIGFQATPYIDANGQTYKPLIRALCYVHPTNDLGAGDGKNSYELQIAMDDTINANNDRVSMATFPTLKVNRLANQDNPTIYMAPGHNIEYEGNPDDIQEFKISDGSGGAMTQVAFFKGQMQQTTANFPTTMGGLPSKASTTATAVAGATQQSSTRTHYKDLTLEHTGLVPLYWMITHMTARFMKPETGQKLLGDKVFDFDPTLDYFYRPLSQSIETEYSKQANINRLIQLYGMTAQVQHPDTVKQLNLITTKIYELMGDEFSNFRKKLLAENVPITPQGGGQNELPGPGGGAEAPSNQNGIPQGAEQAQVREIASGGA